jgi:hypothetical protein
MTIENKIASKNSGRMIPEGNSGIAVVPIISTVLVLCG